MKRMILGVVIALLVSAAAAFAESVYVPVVVLDPWPPYIAGDNGETPRSGIFLDLAKELFNRVDTGYKMTLYPWNRCIKMIEDGDADILFGVTKTAEREAIMEYTIPLFINAVSIFYDKTKFPNGIKWETFDDLKKYKIGVVRGYNNGKPFNEFMSTIHVDESESEMKGLEKLLIGRMELFVCYGPSASFWISKRDQFKDVLVKADRDIDALEFHLGISKKSELVKVIDLIDKAIKEMKDDGTFDKIMSKWE